MLKYAFNPSCRSISPAPSTASSNESNLSLNSSSNSSESSFNSSGSSGSSSIVPAVSASSFLFETPSPPPSFANSRSKSRLSFSPAETDDLRDGFSTLNLSNSRRRLSVTSVSSCMSSCLQSSVLRIYSCEILRPDIQFKTMSVTSDTTAAEVIKTLLSKCKVKYKDPRLFALSMQVEFRSPQGSMTKGSIDLESSAIPLQLMDLYPKGQAKICLKAKQGRLVCVFDNSGTQGWNYKALMISPETTARELLEMIFPSPSTSGNNSSGSTNSSTSSLFNPDPSLYSIYIERTKYPDNFRLDKSTKVLEKLDELMSRDKMSGEPKVIMVQNPPEEKMVVKRLHKYSARRGRCGSSSNQSTLSLYENHFLFDEDSCFIDDVPEEYPIVYGQGPQKFELTPPPQRWRSGEIFRTRSSRASSGSSEADETVQNSNPKKFLSQKSLSKTSTFSPHSFFV